MSRNIPAHRRKPRPLPKLLRIRGKPTPPRLVPNFKKRFVAHDPPPERRSRQKPNRFTIPAVVLPLAIGVTAVGVGQGLLGPGGAFLGGMAWLTGTARNVLNREIRRR